MFFNNLRPLDKFMITDLTTNTGIHPFSTGYVSWSRIQDDGSSHGVLIFNRYGKNGAMRCEIRSLTTLPFMVNSTDSDSELPFLLSESYKNNILSATSFEFVPWACALAILIRDYSNSKIWRQIRNNDVKKLLDDLNNGDYNEGAWTDWHSFYANTDIRRSIVNNLLYAKQFMSKSDSRIHVSDYALIKKVFRRRYDRFRNYAANGDTHANCLLKILAEVRDSNGDLPENSEGYKELIKESNYVKRFFKDSCNWL